MRYQELLKYICGFFLVTSLAACGSSSSTSSSTTTTTSTAASVSSLEEIPDLTEMVASASSSFLAASQSAFAVSGTPPAVADITASNIDTYFWGGLLAELEPESEGDPINITDEAQFGEFFDGEAACRTVQDVAESFGYLEQAATSMCYLKLAPTASSGIELTTNPNGYTAANIFAQDEETKIIKIDIEGEIPGPEGEEGDEGGAENEDIYITVYGSGTTEGSNGYAVDLTFCEAGVTTGAPNGHEAIRVNNSTGVITANSYQTSFGTFSSEFTGVFEEDADGNVGFADGEDQSIVVTFNEAVNGDFTFKGSVVVNSGSMTSKSWYEGTFGDGEESVDEERKVYATTAFDGTSSEDFGLLSSDVTSVWSNNGTTDSFVASTEWQTSAYALLSEDPEAFDFDADSFFDGTLQVDQELASANSEKSCAITPDAVVTMDMEDTAFISEVQDQCEASFDNTRFCDGENLQLIREAIYRSDFFGE